MKKTAQFIAVFLLGVAATLLIFNPADHAKATQTPTYQLQLFNEWHPKEQTGGDLFSTEDVPANLGPKQIRNYAAQAAVEGKFAVIGTGGSATHSVTTANVCAYENYAYWDNVTN